MTVNEVVEKVMRDRDWSRSKVARHIGVPQTTCSNWQRGHLPSPDKLQRLLKLAGVDFDELDFSVAQDDEETQQLIVDESGKVPA